MDPGSPPAPGAPPPIPGLKVTYVANGASPEGRATRVVKADRCDFSNWEAVRVLLREQLRAVQAEQGVAPVPEGVARWPFVASYTDAEGDDIALWEAGEWADFLAAVAPAAQGGRLPRITVVAKVPPAAAPSGGASGAGAPIAACGAPDAPAAPAAPVAAALAAAPAVVAGSATPNGSAAPAPSAPAVSGARVAREASVETTGSLEDQIVAIDRLVELEMAAHEGAASPERSEPQCRSSPQVIDVDEPHRPGWEHDDRTGRPPAGDRGRPETKDRDYGTIQLHMSGINPSVQEPHIRTFLKDFTRNVLRIHRRRETYCFIHFSDIEAAVEAVNALDGQQLSGRHVNVELAVPTCEYFGLPPKPKDVPKKIAMMPHRSALKRPAARSPDHADWVARRDSHERALTEGREARHGTDR